MPRLVPFQLVEPKYRSVTRHIYGPKRVGTLGADSWNGTSASQPRRSAARSPARHAVGFSLHRTASECQTPEECRRGLIGRPEGRPRRERVLKDAGASPSFRTDPAAEAGLQPVRSPVATPQRPFSVSRY